MSEFYDFAHIRISSDMGDFQFMRLIRQPMCLLDGNILLFRYCTTWL